MRTTIALLTIALVFALGVMGQAPSQPAPIPDNKSSQPAPQPVPKGTHEMTASDVEAFLDGIVPCSLVETTSRVRQLQSSKTENCSSPKVTVSRM